MKQKLLAQFALVVVVGLLRSSSADATPCPDFATEVDGIEVGMRAYLVPAKRMNTWEDSGQGATFKPGIKNLFIKSNANVNRPVGWKVCHNCHGPDAASSKYTACSVCHAGDINGMPNPDWLNFAGDGTKTKLLRNSYSAPGYTKAHASLFRSTSGSMPPGKDGWCDEIVQWFQAWLDAGMP